MQPGANGRVGPATNVTRNSLRSLQPPPAQPMTLLGPRAGCHPCELGTGHPWVAAPGSLLTANRGGWPGRAGCAQPHRDGAARAVPAWSHPAADEGGDRKAPSSHPDPPAKAQRSQQMSLMPPSLWCSGTGCFVVTGCMDPQTALAARTHRRPPNSHHRPHRLQHTSGPSLQCLKLPTPPCPPLRWVRVGSIT